MGRDPSQFCETSAKVKGLLYGSVNLNCEKFVVKGRTFLRPPNTLIRPDGKVNQIKVNRIKAVLDWKNNILDF